MTRPTPSRCRRGGFTITEVLVVIGIIAVLAGVLLAALAGARRSAYMTDSMTNMRQIGTWMRLYAADNREHIVPSQFDYGPAQFGNKGFVRSVPPTTGAQNAGTWTDILWTVFEVGTFPGAVASLSQDYRYDSPDAELYEAIGGFDDNPFRSKAANTTQVDGGTGPRPFGTGAQESGLPGFMAANDFFNARPDRPGGSLPAGTWFLYGQIRSPERSMYLVDSFAGEVIGGIGGDADFDFTGLPPTGVVDFRYTDACLMLFLDGHVGQQSRFEDLADLEGRGLRVADPTMR